MLEGKKLNLTLIPAVEISLILTNPTSDFDSSLRNQRYQRVDN